MTIDEEQKDIIRKGRIVEQLLKHPGWPLVLDIFEELGNDALRSLRECQSTHPDIIRSKLINWQLTEKILHEVQIRVMWHREMMEDLIKEVLGEKGQLDPMEFYSENDLTIEE